MSESGVTCCSKLFSLCTAVSVYGVMALLFLLASWALGGDGYKGSLLGTYAISLLILSITVGVALNFAARRHTEAQSR